MESSIKINNFYKYPVTGKQDDSFIGIKIKNNKIDFYYPETYNISDDIKELRKDIIAILRTIKIAKTFSSNKTKIESTSTNNGEFAITSYLWVINDYLNNGIYINREKVLKTNHNGKINWKRTLNTQPIISNGNVIYNELIVEVNSEVENIMVEIYKLVLKNSIDFIGWLYNLNSKFLGKINFNDKLKKQYIYILKSELEKTFDDYKKIRLKNMLHVLQGLNDKNNNNEITYGVDTYYYIFEKMIDSIFSSKEDQSEYNPKATWHLVRNDFKSEDSSSLYPDTIFIDKEKNNAYVIDAKYYRFGFTGLVTDLPKTRSIHKQITYGEFINKKFGDLNSVRNAFILPYNSYNNSFETNEILYFFGFSKSEWKDGKEDFEKVYSFLMDTKYIINCWNKFNQYDDIKKLIATIETQI